MAGAVAKRQRATKAKHSRGHKRYELKFSSTPSCFWVKIKLFLQEMKPPLEEPLMKKYHECKRGVYRIWEKEREEININIISIILK